MKSILSITDKTLPCYFKNSLPSASFNYISLLFSFVAPNHFISTSLSYWLPGTFLQSSSCFFCSSNSKDAARIFFASLHASSVTDTRQVFILMKKKIIIKLVHKHKKIGFIAPFRADFKNENRFFFSSSSIFKKKMLKLI